MMRRFFAIFGGLCLLLALALPALAAAPAAPQVKVDAALSDDGKQVVVTLSVTSTDGVYAIAYGELYYDDSLVSFNSATNSDVFDDLTARDKTDHIRMMWELEQGYEPINGVLATLVFDLREGALRDVEFTLSNAYFTYKDSESGRIKDLEISDVYAAVELHDHQWGDWQTVEAADCEDGLQQRECPVCQGAQTQIIAGTGHQYAQGVCTVCGKEQSQEEPTEPSQENLPAQDPPAQDPTAPAGTQPDQSQPTEPLGPIDAQVEDTPDNTGLIIGVIAAAVLFVGVLLFFLLRKKGGKYL